MKYIDCKQYAQAILDEVKAIPNKKGLVIITVGEDEASKSYVKGKIKDCEYCGIPVEHIKIEDSELASARLIATIQKYNQDDDVAGIIVQLPLPEHFGDINYCNLIVPWKDVDGLGDDSYFEPCTPMGIMYLLDQELGDLTGKSALVIGRSDLVGKPLAKMLLDKDCTVTVAHSKTKNVYTHMINADIVVSAIGKPKHITTSVSWNCEILIDVGINRDEDGKLCGDFNLHGCDRFSCKVTTVPGGVGLLTRAMLMKNVADASTMNFD